MSKLESKSTSLVLRGKKDIKYFEMQNSNSTLIFVKSTTLIELISYVHLSMSAVMTNAISKTGRYTVEFDRSLLFTKSDDKYIHFNF